MLALTAMPGGLAGAAGEGAEGRAGRGEVHDPSAALVRDPDRPVRRVDGHAARVAQPAGVRRPQRTAAVDDPDPVGAELRRVDPAVHLVHGDVPRLHTFGRPEPLPGHGVLVDLAGVGVADDDRVRAPVQRDAARVVEVVARAERQPRRAVGVVHVDPPVEAVDADHGAVVVGRDALGQGVPAHRRRSRRLGRAEQELALGVNFWVRKPGMSATQTFPEPSAAMPRPPSTNLPSLVPYPPQKRARATAGGVVHVHPGGGRVHGSRPRRSRYIRPRRSPASTGKLLIREADDAPTLHWTDPPVVGVVDPERAVGGEVEATGRVELRGTAALGAELEQHVAVGVVGHHDLVAAAVRDREPALGVVVEVRRVAPAGAVAAGAQELAGRRVDVDLHARVDVAEGDVAVDRVDRDVVRRRRGRRRS